MKIRENMCPWDLDDNCILRLSRSGLGNFIFTILTHDGDITNMCVIGNTVNPRVWLTEEAKNTIEQTTKYRFHKPIAPDFGNDF